jgi:hypothetical protein
METPSVDPANMLQEVCPAAKTLATQKPEKTAAISLICINTSVVKTKKLDLCA